jgi:hypothetical protein
MVSSAEIPIVPLMAMTSPGRAAASAARKPVSSLTVTVRLVGQVNGVAAAWNDGTSFGDVGGATVVS